MLGVEAQTAPVSPTHCMWEEASLLEASVLGSMMLLKTMWLSYLLPVMGPGVTEHSR
jgi:hypothetical protein